MKGSEKPKKLLKKQAQKALKQRRVEKRVAPEEIRLQPTVVGGGRRSRSSGLLAPVAEHCRSARDDPATGEIRMSGQATLSFGGDTILLQPAEIDRLLRSLRQIKSLAAASMAEEISARTLTGHIELSPTEAELEAIFSALVRLRSVAEELSALSRFLALVQHQQARTRRSGRPSPTTWPRALVVAEEPTSDRTRGGVGRRGAA
jgi:hypothetical protein